MKRIGNIYSKIYDLNNLKLADMNARKGKKNRYGVIVHDRDAEKNLLKLQNSLIEKTFVNSRYDIFTIETPKLREIYRLPYYPDRILHHAIMNILEPIWVKIFTRDTYSCVKGKGIHGALYQIKRDLKDVEGTKYCLKMDIRKFYPSIDHDILKEIIARKIKDKDVLWLLGVIIDSADGVPIGNYLSQYFANLYLTYFDHWLKERKGVKYYYRYADDLVIFSDRKDFLHDLRKDIQVYLKNELKLDLKKNYRVFPTSEGVDFVGYVFYHTHILMRKTIKKRFAKKARKNKDIEMIAAYYGWAKHCNSKHLLKKLKIAA